MNYLLIESLQRNARYFGDDLTVEHPVGSGTMCTLAGVADELSRRLVSLFLEDSDGRRPAHGGYDNFQNDPASHSMEPFHEYFNGEGRSRRL